MSQRMTDERMAELIRIVFPKGVNIAYDLVSELLQALKAEREYAEDNRRVMLEACEANRHFVAQIEAVRELPGKWRNAELSAATKERKYPWKRGVLFCADELDAALDESGEGK